MEQKSKKIINTKAIALIFLMGIMFIMPLVYALDFDNTKSTIDIDKGQSYQIGDKLIAYNPLWEKYKPIEVKNWFGIGETLLKGAIVEHTEQCGENCYSIIDINLATKSILVEDIKFNDTIRGYKIYIKDGEQEQEVVDYQSQCYADPTEESRGERCNSVKVGSHIELIPIWKEYNIGDVLNIGDYEIKLTGEKRAERIVDWQIKTQGIWTTEWASWGSSTLTTDLQSYWPFDVLPTGIYGAGSNVNTTEVSGRSLNLTLQNFESADWQGAGIKKGWLSDGVDEQMISIIQSTNLNINGTSHPWTFNFWTYSLDQTTREGIFSIGTQSAKRYTGVEKTATINEYQTSNWDTDPVFSTPGASSYWIMITTQYNGTHLRAFINGTLVASTLVVNPEMNPPGETNLMLDRMSWGGNYYKGYIDEFGVWNRSLTQSEITALFNSGSGITYPFTNGIVTLNYPLNNVINTTTSIIGLNSSATITGGSTLVNVTLFDNSTGSWGARNSSIKTGTSNDTNFFNNYSDNIYIWNMQWCDSDGACGFALTNRTFTVHIESPNININAGNGTQSYGSLSSNYTINYTIYDQSLSSCKLEYNLTNRTIPCSNNTMNSTNFALQLDLYNATIYANDSANNWASKFFSWDFLIFENSLVYSSPLLSSVNNTIIGNFTSNLMFNSIVLNYNGTNYVPLVSSSNNTYIVTSNLYSPIFTSNANVSFYYIFTEGTNIYNSRTLTQEINSLNVSTNCSSGNYQFINISNYDEQTLLNINGTVEYALSLLGVNDNIVSTLYGNFTGINISLCSNRNISDLYNYNLQLRYYTTNYLYETYNIQRSPTSNLPMLVNLYYINNTIGTTFDITYQDFFYITHPGAILQIQRQYLDENLYRVVEIPQLDNNGNSVGSFNANNIRYKIIVVENGEIIDTFEDVFPICQSIVLGQCAINLRGAKTTPPSTEGDFIYSIEKTNTSIILTYIIPSGTPRNIQFLSTQDSRFLNNISNCNTTLFGSGGTLTCSYNQTVGDSSIDLQIINSDGTTLYGSLLVSEDLSSYFLLNNYFIGFIIILTLALMFISSGVMLIVVSVGGLIYLGLVFLLRGMDLVTLTGSLGWLVIMAVIIIYKISQKEEKT